MTFMACPLPQKNYFDSSLVFGYKKANIQVMIEALTMEVNGVTFWRI